MANPDEKPNTDDAPKTDAPKMNARKAYAERAGFKRERERRMGEGQKSQKAFRAEEPTPVIVLADGHWGATTAAATVHRAGSIIMDFVGEAKWVREATKGEVDAEQRRRELAAERAAGRE